MIGGETAFQSSPSNPEHFPSFSLVALLFFAICLVIAPPTFAGSRPRPAAKPKGIYHVVERGQTLFGISRAYGVPVSALLDANRLASRARLRVGQRLLIPGATRAVPVAASKPLTKQERERLELSLREESLVEPPKVDVPATQVKTDALLVWPILGPLNSPYGPRWGRFHAGIDIGSPQYQEVVAAADGEVLYSSETKGALGQAIVVRHADGLRTVYAHLSIIIAEEGETVRQGQPIGGVGSTGRSTGPHLHFEVRHNGTPVDPMQYLPATIDELVRDLSRSRAAEPTRP